MQIYLKEYILWCFFFPVFRDAELVSCERSFEYNLLQFQ